jgi:hypothetical protein
MATIKQVLEHKTGSPFRSADPERALEEKPDYDAEYPPDAPPMGEDAAHTLDHHRREARSHLAALAKLATHLAAALGCLALMASLPQ